MARFSAELTRILLSRALKTSFRLSIERSIIDLGPIFISY